MRFAHFGRSLGTDDGVIVEYDLNGGPCKNVTDKATGATLFDQNPYDQAIEEDDILRGRSRVRRVGPRSRPPRGDGKADQAVFRPS